MKKTKRGKKDRFVELRAAGRSYKMISEELGTPVSTLVSWAKELKLELANARAIHATEIEDRFPVERTKRIEILGKYLHAILAEIDKRDLSDVPTVKLLELALRYGDALKEERQPLELVGGEEILFEERLETWPA